MENVEWKVAGMTCSNCALSVQKYLNSEGMQDIKVNPISGAVSFKNPGVDEQKLEKGIKNIGYEVVHENQHHGHSHTSGGFLKNNKQRILFTLPFTAILMLHMLDGWIHLHWLMNPWVQLALCLPVFIVGMAYFGKSAYHSLKSGVPNMDVLITIGAIASFAYSLTGAVLNLGPDYLFFETTASIITLVLLGNYLEEWSIQSTQREVKKLMKTQKVMANMLVFDHEHQEQVFPVESNTLKVGDLILIKTGEQVPIDCKILWGECSVNEAILTGESIPIPKYKKDTLIGGSVIADGVVKAQVTATGSDTVLSGIIKMVEDAQAEKPPIQKMADKISAIFVPLVVGIAILTFMINYFVFDVSSGTSLLRAVAVLVISCPCALGLATPAAVAVGLGRAAKSGILFKNAEALEHFKKINTVVFDKTGTLTTGKFSIKQFQTDLQEEEFKRIIYSLEKYSNHPIGKSIAEHWKHNQPMLWVSIEEVKGKGMKAVDQNGNVYWAGSEKIMNGLSEGHNVYLTINDQLKGWIDITDEIRTEAAEVIQQLHKRGIKTILLSGDKSVNAERVAKELGIQQVLAEQNPEDKLKTIKSLSEQHVVAMVGDGINDAPALAQATVGISLSDASQIAMQHADVLLINKGLKHLPESLLLGKHTTLTIHQNLFWAFIYNIVAIPIAALGFLTPTVAALAMGFSDVVLAFNSGRLFVKKLR